MNSFYPELPRKHFDHIGNQANPANAHAMARARRDGGPLARVEWLAGPAVVWFWEGDPISVRQLASDLTGNNIPAHSFPI